MSNKEPNETLSLEALIAKFRADADKMDAHELPYPTTQYLRMLLERVEAACRRAYDEIEAAVCSLVGISYSAEDFIRERMDKTIGDYYE